MRKNLLVITVILVILASCIFADTIRGINIDFVKIGYAGNAADFTGYGSIGYEYFIGKYEVTNFQWSCFKTHAGNPTGYPVSAYDQVATGILDNEKPVSVTSWYEALQFCNYLTSGDKSRGVYQFSGDNSNPGNFIGINRISAQLVYDRIFFLPTENEWYKAAYYKPDNSGYSLYANGTNTKPIAGVHSNYDSTISGSWNVGTGIKEQNGTFDMMGNLWEWNETLVGSNNCAIRGGSCRFSGGSGVLQSINRFDTYAWYEGYDTGFRIASIPEPLTSLLLCLGAIFIRVKNNKHKIYKK